MRSWSLGSKRRTRSRGSYRQRLGAGFRPVPKQVAPKAAGIFGAWTEHSETAGEHGSRLLFIPDAKNAADWCMVYPKGELVSRVEWSAD